MSRIGKMPITLPAQVEVKVDDNNIVTVKGPKGELKQKISGLIKLNVEDGVLKLSSDSESREGRSQFGLSRTLVNNMVLGVTEGFTKKLVISGVGYKAEKRGNKLVLSLAYSHPVEMEDPEGITTECPTATEILVSGINKVDVGTHAANIRAWRKPEPYKGKGIAYEHEEIRKKEGKSGVKK